MRTSRFSVFTFILTALAAIGFMGCSGDDGDDSNPTGSQNISMRTPNVPIVTPPAAMVNSPNPYVQAAAGMMTMANSFHNMWNTHVAAYSNWSVYDGSWNWAPKQHPPHMAQDDSIAYIHAATTGMTVISAIVETSSDYIWTIVVGENLQSLQKLMEVTEAHDGRSGGFATFSGGSTDMLGNWMLDTNDIYTLEIDGDSNQEADFELIVYPSGAGFMETYDDGTPEWKLSWNADGTGDEWWIYDDEGEIEDHGTDWQEFYGGGA